MYQQLRKSLLFFSLPLFWAGSLLGQTKSQLKYENSQVYAGIEVGSKGVKMSILEIGKNAKKTGAFNVLKDTAVNTDFISFTPTSFGATVKGLSQLYQVAVNEFAIPPSRIFTMVSSGVKMQAEKDNRVSWIGQLADSFRLRIGDPQRTVDIIDVMGEAKLSHLGIVPESRRYTTFLIDIGSGNTKGGYFPNGNTNTLRLFELTWGTKTINNATVKRCEEDNSITNYNRQLTRVLAGDPNNEIIYAVNASGAYEMSDYIAISGGIAWSVANYISPELIENSVVPVTYADVLAFSDRIFKEYETLNADQIIADIKDPLLDKKIIRSELKKVNQVFDQRALMAGTGLLLKIMRQFEGIYEKKQFYLVKNGQVGWISAYVDQQINK